MRGCRQLRVGEIISVFQTSFTVLTQHNAERMMAMAGVMLGTGLRVGECSLLIIRDVCANGALQSALRLRSCITKGKGEGRSIPLNDTAHAALTRWLHFSGLDEFPPSFPLFPAFKPGCRHNINFYERHVDPSKVCADFRRVARAAGLQGKVGTHSLRKTFAEAVYRRSGNDLYGTQYALRHASPNNTIKYLAPVAEKTDAIIRDLF